MNKSEETMWDKFKYYVGIDTVDDILLRQFEEECGKEFHELLMDELNKLTTESDE